ncbi:MAG: penicillin-binding protein 2 [Omnitrophica WOR_2 bacterium RIFCSPHIGHO2_02_FULL_45_21]|nr:MAG: penicillin-binding protein 2 [Omnitrophica WOR_2 bacterium RIFCSPHIGHO2_02_FULL_45_21]
MRINKVRFLIELLFVILLMGVFYLQIIRGNFYFSLSIRNCVRIIPFAGVRGKILDRNGKIIVDNRVSYNISILPREFKQNVNNLDKLAALLNKSASGINKIIKKDFISASRPIIVAKDVDKRTAFLIEENKFALPAVVVEVIPKRSYPYHNSAAHLLGYLARIDRWRVRKLKDYGYEVKDMVGFTGIEESLEQVLRAQDGGIQLEVDHRGGMSRVLGFRQSRHGKDVHLTIDIRIQKIIEHAFAGRRGAVVVMEPDSGRIIALASFPNFYPHMFLEEDNSGYINGLLTDSGAPFMNRAISGQYPLGSIFKVVSAIAALEKKKITAEKRFFCPGRMLAGLKEFNCWSTHHSQDLLEALTHSCNVYFYHLALLLGADTLSEYAGRFGLGKPSGIDLPYEGQGFVPSVLARRIKLRNWYDGDTANFGIGQGDLLVTPMQAVRLIAAIANGGKLVVPYIVERIDNQELKPKPATDLGLDAKIIKTVIEGLKQVVNAESGTANIGWGNLKVAGKTGTAQVKNKLSHGWFVGFLPYDKPKLVFCFFLEHTGPSIHAVVLAHQVFKQLQEEGLL